MQAWEDMEDSIETCSQLYDAHLTSEAMNQYYLKNYSTDMFNEKYEAAGESYSTDKNNYHQTYKLIPISIPGSPASASALYSAESSKHIVADIKVERKWNRDELHHVQESTALLSSPEQTFIEKGPEELKMDCTSPSLYENECGISNGKTSLISPSEPFSDAITFRHVQEFTKFLINSPEEKFIYEDNEVLKMDCTFPSFCEDTYGILKDIIPNENTSLKSPAEPFSDFAENFPDLAKLRELNTKNMKTSRNYSTNQIRLADKRVINLVPKSLMASVGFSQVATNDLCLIIIQWDPILFLSRDESEKFPIINNNIVVYNSFEQYYNMQFSLILQDAWKNIEKKIIFNENSELDFKINNFEERSTYLKISCVKNINYHDIKSLPKTGYLAITTFKSKDKKCLQMLAYVQDVDYALYSDPPRNRKESSKASISIFVAFKLCGIDIEAGIKVQSLINIKKFLMQHDALLRFNSSPLRDVILNPRGPYVNSFVLPHLRHGIDKTQNLIQGMMNVIYGPYSQLVLLQNESLNSPAVAIYMLVSEISQSLKSKVLICIKSENDFDLMAKIFSDKNLIIFGNSSDKDSKFQNYTLDKLPSVKNATNVKLAKCHALQQSNVLLTMISDCSFDDIHLIRDLNISCCIIYDANLCTESEILVLCTKYCVDKLILIGNQCNDSNYNFYRSLSYRCIEDLSSLLARETC